jgi:hypothetical protein
MSQAIYQKFEQQIREAEERLGAVGEQRGEDSARESGWSRKQVLGHLIDSALNNHQRFVRASLAAEYRGPGYDQDAWVRIHGYDALPWAELVAHWSQQNRLLMRVVERVPPSRYGVMCSVGDYAPMTLLEIMEDYLAHMRHHLEQIYDARQAAAP